MTLIKCNTINPGHSDRRVYQGKTGKHYEFYYEQYTRVDDPTDAKFFLESANGKAFEPKTARKTVMNKLKQLVKGKEKDPEQEQAPPEPEADINIEEADGDVEEIDEDEKLSMETTDMPAEAEQYMVMTKKELDEHAKKEFNIELDRRQTKVHMVNELLEKKQELENNLKEE